MHGDIVYLELALVDIDETLRFYRELFGWTFEESHLSKQKYFMFKTPGESILGALDQNVEPSVSGVQCYIEVDDIDTVLTALSDYAGTEVLKEKTFLSDAYGHYALIKDPSGNKIGLQQDARSESP